MSSTEEELGSLHSLIARTLADQINQGCTVKDKDGNYIVVSATPAVLNVARQFLRDNYISCKPNANADMASLVDSLPFNETRADFN